MKGVLHESDLDVPLFVHDCVFYPELFLFVGDGGFEYPHEHEFDLVLDHFVDAGDCFPEVPVLEAVFEEAVEVGEFEVLFGPEDALDDAGELGLFEFVLLLVEHLLDVFVLLEEVVVAELAALDLVPDGLLQHEEPLLQDAAEREVLVERLLALYRVHYAHQHLALLLPQTPHVKCLLHLPLQVLAHPHQRQLLVQLLLLPPHLLQLQGQLLRLRLEGVVLLVLVVDAGGQGFALDGGEDLGLVVHVLDFVVGLHEHLSQSAPVLEGEQLLELFEVLDRGRRTLRTMLLF